MRPSSALQWKRFYDEERRHLALESLLDAAPLVELPRDGALIFPHTMLRSSGTLPAAVANAVLRARPSTVLVLGVLHGAREQDAAQVAAARHGDAAARAALRGLHGWGLSEYCAEEFSTDGIMALLQCAYARAGVSLPRIVVRFPFLVGEQPEDLPGLDELRALKDTAIIATGDLQHHGDGYGTPLDGQRGIDARDFARSVVTRELELLCRREFAEHQRHCAAVRSDFRDVGPVLATLLPKARAHTIHTLQLVDYAHVLDARPPTWVAAVLASMHA